MYINNMYIYILLPFYELYKLRYFISGAILITICRLLMKKEVKDIIDILYHTIKRDTKSLMLIIRFMILIKYAEFKGCTIISMFDKMAQKHPNKVVLKSEHKQWTFNQVYISNPL